MLNKPGPRPVPGLIVAVRKAVPSQTVTPNPATDTQPAVTTTTTTAATTQTTTTTPGNTTTTTMTEVTPTLSPQAQVVQQSNQDGPRRLAQAIHDGNLAQVQAVLAQSIGPLLRLQPLEDDATALQLAARKGRTEIVAFLLGLGPDTVGVNRADGVGGTPLHEAACVRWRSGGVGRSDCAAQDESQRSIGPRCDAAFPGGRKWQPGCGAIPVEPSGR